MYQVNTRDAATGSTRAARRAGIHAASAECRSIDQPDGVRFRCLVRWIDPDAAHMNRPRPQHPHGSRIAWGRWGDDDLRLLERLVQLLCRDAVRHQRSDRAVT